MVYYRDDFHFNIERLFWSIFFEELKKRKHQRIEGRLMLPFYRHFIGMMKVCL
jgi:hypothetical protein